MKRHTKQLSAQQKNMQMVEEGDKKFKDAINNSESDFEAISWEMCVFVYRL